jgi:hypothetical protein
MKNILSLSLLPALLLGVGHGAWAQQIYRCAGVGGSAPEYINNVKDAQSRGCSLVSGGNVTVVQGAPVSRSSPPARAATGNPAPAGQRSNDSDTVQRARDSDARLILEAELKKSEARLAELQKEYNNGEPAKQGIEARNYQRYLDRVNELKESLARSQSDVASLRREIARLPSPN